MRATPNDVWALDDVPTGRTSTHTTTTTTTTTTGSATTTPSASVPFGGYPQRSRQRARADPTVGEGRVRKRRDDPAPPHGRERDTRGTKDSFHQTFDPRVDYERNPYDDGWQQQQQHQHRQRQENTAERPLPFHPSDGAFGETPMYPFIADGDGQESDSRSDDYDDGTAPLDLELPPTPLASSMDSFNQEGVHARLADASCLPPPGVFDDDSQQLVYYDDGDGGHYYQRPSLPPPPETALYYPPPTTTTQARGSSMPSDERDATTRKTTGAAYSDASAADVSVDRLRRDARTRLDQRAAAAAAAVAIRSVHQRFESEPSQDPAHAPQFRQHGQQQPHPSTNRGTPGYAQPREHPGVPPNGGPPVEQMAQDYRPTPIDRGTQRSERAVQPHQQERQLQQPAQQQQQKQRPRKQKDKQPIKNAHAPAGDDGSATRARDRETTLLPLETRGRRQQHPPLPAPTPAAATAGGTTPRASGKRDGGLPPTLYNTGGFIVPLTRRKRTWQLPVCIARQAVWVAVSTTRRALTVSTRDLRRARLAVPVADLVASLPAKRVQLYCSDVVLPVRDPLAMRQRHTLGDRGSGDSRTVPGLLSWPSARDGSVPLRAHRQEQQQQHDARGSQEPPMAGVRVRRYDFYVGTGGFASRLGLLGGPNKRSLFVHLRLPTDLFALRLQHHCPLAWRACRARLSASSASSRQQKRDRPHSPGYRPMDAMARRRIPAAHDDDPVLARGPPDMPNVVDGRARRRPAGACDADGEETTATALMPVYGAPRHAHERAGAEEEGDDRAHGGADREGEEERSYLALGAAAEPPEGAITCSLVHATPGDTKGLIALAAIAVRVGHVSFQFSEPLPAIVHAEVPGLCVPRSLYNAIVEQINKLSGLFGDGVCDEHGQEALQRAATRLPPLSLLIERDPERGGRMRLTVPAWAYTLWHRQTRPRSLAGTPSRASDSAQQQQQQQQQQQHRASGRLQLLISPLEPPEHEDQQCMVLGAACFARCVAAFSSERRQAWFWSEADMYPRDDDDNNDNNSGSAGTDNGAVGLFGDREDSSP